jgi:hypothetical protein
MKVGGAGRKAGFRRRRADKRGFGLRANGEPWTPVKRRDTGARNTEAARGKGGGAAVTTKV